MIATHNFNVDDERSPLDRLRLSELRVLMTKHNLEAPPMARKADLLQILNGMALLDTLTASCGKPTKPSLPEFVPPSQEAVDEARNEIRRELSELALPEFVAWCKENDIAVSATLTPTARAKLIENYINGE